MRDFAKVRVAQVFTCPSNVHINVPRTELDTLYYGSKVIAYNVKASANTGNVVVKAQGSIDAQTWNDLLTRSSNGAAHSANDVTITANSTVGQASQLFITGTSEQGNTIGGVVGAPAVNAGYRLYRLSARAEVDGDTPEITIVGIAK